MDLLKEYFPNIEKLINIAVPIIDYHCPIKYSPNQKYNNKYFFICLIDFFQRHVCWRSYRGTEDFPISGKYLNSIHLKYCNNNVYEEIHKVVVKKYLSQGREKKLKIQEIDSSYVANKQGIHNLRDKPSDKDKEMKKKAKYVKNPTKYENNINDKKIQFNGHNGRKKYIKISAITDSLGAALGIGIVSGIRNDVSTVEETIEKIPIELNTLKNSKHNRYKQTFLADSGYRSKKNITILENMGYTPIIAYNKRNTKNKEIIKKNSFTKKQKKIYKKRGIIESFFSWIKRFPVINQNYQKILTSYNGLLLLAASVLISNKW